jgi:hypothetical protein
VHSVVVAFNQCPVPLSQAQTCRARLKKSCTDGIFVVPLLCQAQAETQLMGNCLLGSQLESFCSVRPRVSGFDGLWNRRPGITRGQ